MRLEMFSWKLFVDLVFKVVIGCGVRDSGETGKSGGSAQIANRDPDEVA